MLDSDTDYYNRAQREQVIVVAVPVPTEPRRARGRPRNPNRVNADGSYNRKPLDPDYFKTYYKRRKKMVACEICGKEVMDSYLRMHQTTSGCMRVAYNNALGDFRRMKDTIGLRNVQEPTFSEFATNHCRDTLIQLHENRLAAQQAQ